MHVISLKMRFGILIVAELVMNSSLITHNAKEKCPICYELANNIFLHYHDISINLYRHDLLPVVEPKVISITSEIIKKAKNVYNCSLAYNFES